ncbi:MAG: hypothetical protein A3C30_02745 [Candidatus Levybacteria bacterium RIFCSPHIGHO2_02_FULL_40_18]|nr:MAG: hypothetical protein A2869_05230 [Candidatus Levybacteria bacterium RIFCSPHIGHO2_01_FULL_40_58]OGH26894.1 MAG: hypothetical protein A3C30_02745 [Candidatus Levybacteria bacterium RIFCSPHIGHO2_02_FULL_40_18]OGH32016.1 MAG: hypothetical protein A3E43_03725 [Candidatus Levybacteria bacterium RIFCSPHIGHO2_12_FULL_40_31]OGH40862.1 MAG: hypothetical protein A2894_04675 [Candidatus Levybacteria bacterium RIFCSPLOWO2_01_FULL_40_64]OGH52783.1 MAG: hypothetical protein A3G15_00425 [Candidatus Lev
MPSTLQDTPEVQTRKEAELSHKPKRQRPKRSKDVRLRRRLVKINGNNGSEKRRTKKGGRQGG